MSRWLWLLGGGLAGAAWRAGTSSSPSRSGTGEEALRERERALQQREQALAAREQALGDREHELQRQQTLAAEKLEQVAGLSREDALKRLHSEIHHSQQQAIQQFSDAEWDRLASSRLATAMGRIVVRQVAEQTVSVVALPSEEMKGRIIGKDGRNLRMFESLTGVDVLVDDAPQSVALSCFDGARREVARLALESLVSHGRISAPRIEEAVATAREQVERGLEEKGAAAAAEAQVSGLHPELVRTLGQLAFRTSYGQNVLQHSVEVSRLCAALAAELKVDVEVSRRAGLLHDLGKALPDGGPHAPAGAALCRRKGESEPVCHAIAAHHYDVPQESVEAALVTVADAISAARPGARREHVQAYLERLHQLEALAMAQPGVSECQVVQAGREIRVFVRPELVDDTQCQELVSRLISEIEQALPVPGRVKVTVIRPFEAAGRTR